MQQDRERDHREQSADKTAIRPFHVNNVAEEELTEMRRRIEATKWPEQETVTDASGLYRAWGQFQHEGRVLTADFTFEVPG
jgi:hypothetical protein